MEAHRPTGRYGTCLCEGAVEAKETESRRRQGEKRALRTLELDIGVRLGHR